MEAAAVIVVIMLLVRRNPFDLTTRWIGEVDTKYYGWLAWRLSRLTGPTWRLTGVVHPAGLELSLLDGLAPITVSGVLARVFGRYLGLNLTILIGLVLNYLGARRLATVMGASGVWRVMCGLAFVAAPIFASPASSFPPLLWAFTTPLLVAEFVRAARGDVEFRRWTVAALLVVAYVCSIYHLVFGGLAALIVGLAWPVSRLRTRAGAARLVAGVAVAAVVLLPFGVARLRYTSSEHAAGAPADQLSADTLTFSADLADPLVLPAPPGPFGSVRLGLHERPLERFRSGALGWALLAGVIAGLRRRPTGWGALAAATGVLWIATLGPRLIAWGHVPLAARWLPYRLLVAVPGLSALRAPYRAAIPLAALGVAFLAACQPAAVASLAAGRSSPATLGPSEGRRVWVPVLALGLLMMVSWWPRVATTTSGPPRGLETAFAEIEADPARRAVIVVPFTCSFDDLDVLNWQTAHHHPMVSCGVSTSATRWYTRASVWFTSAGLAAARCHPELDVFQHPSAFSPDLRLDSSGLAELHNSFDVRWVVFDQARGEGCPTATATLAALGGSRIMAQDGRYLVVDLDQPATG